MRTQTVQQGVTVNRPVGHDARKGLTRRITNPARELGDGLRAAGLESILEVVDRGRFLAWCHAVRRRATATGKACPHGGIQQPVFRTQGVDPRELLLHRMAGDPGQGCLLLHLLAGDRDLRCGNCRLALGHRHARLALGAVGKFLPQPDPAHGHEIVADPVPVRAVYRQVVQTQGELRIGQLPGRQHCVASGVQLRRVGAQRRCFANGQVQRAHE